MAKLAHPIPTIVNTDLEHYPRHWIYSGDGGILVAAEKPDNLGTA